MSTRPEADVPADVLVLHASPGNVDITLDEPRMSGYRWILDSAPQQVVPLGTLSTESSSAVGGVSTTKFSFRVEATGEFELNFFRLEDPRRRVQCDIARSN